MMKKLWNENGFSLLEVSVAVAIMVILTGVAVTIAPNFMNTVRLKTDANASCDFKKEAAAQSLINGVEPTQTDTVNGQSVAAHECQPEKNSINGGN